MGTHTLTDEESIQSDSYISPNKAKDHSEETWSARRAKHKTSEKRLMAQYCARHDFLVREGANPETDPRETVASILVNQGTTPNIVVEEALEWIKMNEERGPFDITWYTPGNLVPGTLYAFRKDYPKLSASAQLFLFPGRVDQQTESVSGPEAEEFAERLERCFTYAFVSAYSLDLNTGSVYFHMPAEVRLQKACATRYAAHKFLFLDSSKFKIEGEIGYGISDLLSNSEAVTIYTVSSKDKDLWIKEKFRLLCDKIFGDEHAGTPPTVADGVRELDMKTLRLRIVSTSLDTQTDSDERRGFPIQAEE